MNPPSAGAGRAPGFRRRFVWRWSRRVLVLIAAAIAAAVVALFSIDLGPAARKRAEAEATKYLERPMHIGRLSAYVWPGDFLLEDVVIEGKHPGDRPFLQAKRIRVSVPWLTLLRFNRDNRALFAEVRMTDWKMSIETWPGQGNSLPKFLPKNPSKGPKPFTTTVRHVFAQRGDLIYEDHGTPWTVHAPNLNFALVRAENLKSHVGTASFSAGLVQIQNFLPMRTDFTTRFTLDAPIVRLHHIDLLTDGARSNIKGVVDLAHYPEATYDVDSQIDFARMRELYFANERWRVNGDGGFKGTFHMFPGGYDLHGRFQSPMATLRTPDRTLQFPNLHGALQWQPKQFAVTDAGSDFYGGRSNFSYKLAPLGTPAGSTATFGFDYDNVDLEAFTRGIEWRDMDLRGRASGSNNMTWHNGQFSGTMTGNGRAFVTPPPGSAVAAAALPASIPPAATESAPFDRTRPLGPLPVAGELVYRLDPDGIEMDPSWAATAATYLAFHGRADYGAKSNIAFHVTSLDWQQSDRLLAAILSAAGGPTSAVEVGGYGQFDGAMTGPFSQPRVAGHFAGKDVKAWGTRWGRSDGDIVIENGYVTVNDGVIGDTSSARILADGRFSLGFPRKDNGEEINGHVRVQNWPLADLRHAFSLDGWPVEGTVTTDVHLTSKYQNPLGSGTLRIDKGTAWGETFETATSDLTFNGVGLEMVRILMSKDVGHVNGSALIKWDGTYSFDTRGDLIPVQSLTSFTFPAAPLSGVLQFSASGAGSFDSPVYEFKGRVADLFAGSEGVGDMSGTLQVRDNVLSIPQLDIASSRLQMSGLGSIALNATYDSNLTFRFTDSSVDPYLQYISPNIASKISQYTRAKVSGLLQVQGPFKPAAGNTKGFDVTATIDDAQLVLLNYALKNDGEVRLKLSDNTFSISRLVLTGTDTRLSLEGTIPPAGTPMNVIANGSANLAILQGFFPNLISSGAATLSASIVGDRSDPHFTGRADIVDGRLRYRSFPHGLDSINGPITFGANGIRVGQFDAEGQIVERLRGRMGEGDVILGGTIDLKGLAPDQFNLTADGRSMKLRYPSGFTSTVDASLTLTGPITGPTLGGNVTVLRSTYQQEIDSDLALLGLAAAGGPAPTEVAALSETSFPLKFDVRLNASRTLGIDSKDAQVVGSANLYVRGTVDAPVITGQVTIDRANVFFNGNRITVPHGTVSFSGPVEPFFDVEMNTRARRANQTYNVTVRITGTADKPNLTLNSDPFLPMYDLMSLLLGERPNVLDVEGRTGRTPQLSQQQAMRTAAAQLLAMPLSSRVGSVVQRTIPFDTFSIVPLLGNDASLQQLNPGARVTLGKRISDRVFLTYSRALNSPDARNEIILLEYEQSDRVSWVLSRNEDRSFALDFRIRHVF